MPLLSIISNLFLITNLITLPISDNFYIQESITNDNNTFFTIQSEKIQNENKFPIKEKNDSIGVKISAKSVLVEDGNTGKKLWSKNSQEVRPIASITKLMTSLVLLDLKNIDWEKEVIINEEKLNGDFHKLNINTWEKVKFKDLFIASLVASSNTGINIIVKNTGLSEEEFVNRMNQKAIEMNLKNTKFEDPTGLGSNNVSTAEEVLKLTRAAFSYPNIKQATSNENYSFSPTNSSRVIYVKNTNELIGGYLDIDAGKTGYTESAGFCLTSEINYQEEGPILVVVLGSDSHYERFSDLKTMSTWVFNNYSWK